MSTRDCRLSGEKKKWKRNEYRETYNYNRSGNRALFFSAHSYTFVSSRFILSFFPSSSFFSFRRFVLFFFCFRWHRDKLADVLLTHSSTINLLFTGRNKPSFLLRHTVPQTLLWISSITPRYPPVHPSCSRLFPTCPQTCALSRHRVLLSTCNQPPDPCLTNFSNVRTSQESKLGKKHRKKKTNLILHKRTSIAGKTKPNY